MIYFTKLIALLGVFLFSPQLHAMWPWASPPVYWVPVQPLYYPSPAGYFYAPPPTVIYTFPIPPPFYVVPAFLRVVSYQRTIVPSRSEEIRQQEYTKNKAQLNTRLALEGGQIQKSFERSRERFDQALRNTTEGFEESQASDLAEQGFLDAVVEIDLKQFREMARWLSRSEQNAKAPQVWIQKYPTLAETRFYSMCFAHTGERYFYMEYLSEFAVQVERWALAACRNSESDPSQCKPLGCQFVPQIQNRLDSLLEETARFEMGS